MTERALPFLTPILLLLALVIGGLSCGRPDSEARNGQPGADVDSAISDEGSAADGTATLELVEEVELSPTDIQRIGRNLDVDVSGGVNVFYEVSGVRVQCNYLTPESEDELVDLFHALFSLVGSRNAVLLGEDRVYELITDDPFTGEAVLATLDLASLQDIKLNPFRIFGEAEMIRDELVIGADLRDVAERLGIELAVLINQEIDINGENVRVNFLMPGEGTSVEDAFDALADVKGSESGLYVLHGSIVEVVTDRSATADMVWRLIPAAPPSRFGPNRFEVSFTTVPVDEADYMLLNQCSNEAIGGASVRQLTRIDRSLEFGDTLPLFLNGGTTEFLSNPSTEVTMIDDSVAEAVIADEGGRGWGNRVEVVMEVETGTPLTEGPEDEEEYLEATKFWPVESRSIDRALDEALYTLEDTSDRSTAEAIHAWVRDSIRFGGDVEGSRYGTEQVMGLRYGRCWDFSDVFITMARGEDLPTRQIAGWLYGGEGHVWSQVWLEDEGVWLDVDPTRDEIGVDSFYIPIWGTIDGEMMFLYTEWPEIKRLDE